MESPLLKKLAVIVTSAVSLSSLGVLAATAHEVPGCRNPVPQLRNPHCQPGHDDDDNGGGDDDDDGGDDDNGGGDECRSLLDSIVSAVLTGDVDVDLDDPLTVDASAILCVDADLPVGYGEDKVDHVIEKLSDIEIKEAAAAAAAKVLFVVGKVEHKVDWLLEHAEEEDMEEGYEATLLVIAEARAEVDLMLHDLRGDVRRAVGGTLHIAFDALGDAKENVEAVLRVAQDTKEDVAETGGAAVFHVGGTVFSLRDNVGSALHSVESVEASIRAMLEIGGDDD